MPPPAPCFSWNELNADNAMVRFGLESEEGAPAFLPAFDRGPTPEEVFEKYGQLVSEKQRRELSGRA
jgi:hypothetical protein